MEEYKLTNYAMLRGTLAGMPKFSHESRGEEFYTFPLEIQRLSGNTDTVNIVARSQTLDELEIGESSKLCVLGEVRSFNNKSGVGPKLIITVFAKELWFDDGEDENIIELRGVLCKKPNIRVTPMGREICDLMLAVNRRYGRSDYLPCIAWGTKARQAALWDVGSSVYLTGRLQSRLYTKTVDGETVEKTAYEVSVIDLCEDT